MEKPMEYFANGLTLSVSEDCFPLSTDSMILAHFAKLPKNATVLDLGAGCGTLGILLCAKDPACRVTGIELSPQAHEAATENILLAANAIGLGGVWTGLYPDENRAGAVAKVLKLPETFIPLCTIVIGHPAEQPTPKDKWKPENISYNEYGGKAE